MLFRLKLYRFLLGIAIYPLPFVAFNLGWRIWAAVSLYMNRPIIYSRDGHFVLELFSCFVWAFMAARYKVTNVDELFRERTGAKAAWSATLATVVVLIAVLYFGRQDIFPRGLFVFITAELLTLTIFVHAVFRFLCRRNLKLGRPTRILIVGADRFAVDAAARLERLSLAPCEVVGWVQLPGQQIAIPGAEVYALDEISHLNAGNGIDEAVIAIQPMEFSRIPLIVEALKKLSVPARAIVDLGEGIVVRERLFQIGRMQMLDLTATPADSPDYALVKRIFDICFAGLVLVLGAPLMALIALVIRLTSSGPIFFSQNRVGLNGLPFRMYKFRTMRSAQPGESDICWTTEQDSRRTYIGTFLRKTSLDELPQFLNVLKGDMSVVGPRPERPHFVDQFLKEVTRYNHRHCLRVGITGWAQVNGWRGDTSIEKRVEYDLYYLQNWTFGFDLRIILMTILSVIVGKNAY